MAATVATWFMETEEEGLEGDFVPMHARLTIVKNDFVLRERRAGGEIFEACRWAR